MNKQIKISEIEVQRRLRPADAPHVDALATSMACFGLRHPIEVTANNVLISGLHRLEAAKRLGWKEIAATVLDVDEAEAQLLEVEENLIRHDLTVLDRALHVMRFRELFEASYGEISAGGNRQDAEYKEQKHTAKLAVFSETAAERLGIAGNSLLRLQRVAKLPDEVIELLRGTGWDNNQKALLELVGVLDFERQLRAVEALLDPEQDASTMREAIDAAHGVIRKPSEQLERWFTKTSNSILNAKKQARIRLYKEQLLQDLDVFREAALKAGFDLEPRKEGPQK